MLIYAFRDEHGTWHADPDAATRDQPGRGTLTLPPTPPGPDPGQFDGQQLEVLYAPCDLEASQTIYRLDNGGTFLATCHVHELLSAAYQPRPHDAAQSHAGARPPETPTVSMEIGDTQRRYRLTADLIEEGRMDVTIMVCTPDGVIHGELTGELDTSDLTEVSRLLAAAPALGRTAAPAAPSVPVAATRPGREWTLQDCDDLREYHRAGKSPREIGEKLGRTEASIRWKLYSLNLAPRPADLVPAPRTPTQPEPPKAYTLDEKRLVHRNSHKRWTPEEEDQLTLRSAQDAGLVTLVEEFGRNENAINTRLVKIRAQGPAADQARSTTFGEAL